MASTTGRFRQLLKKYHGSVSAASVTGLYIAITNNVDVDSLLHKVGIVGVHHNDADLISDLPEKKNRTAEFAASSGGALALAVLCNKALFPSPSHSLPHLPGSWPAGILLAPLYDPFISSPSFFLLSWGLLCS